MLYITISTTVHNCVLVLAILAICKLMKTKTKIKRSGFGTFIKTGKGSKDDSGSQGRTVKKRSNQLT